MIIKYTVDEQWNTMDVTSVTGTWHVQNIKKINTQQHAKTIKYQEPVQ